MVGSRRDDARKGYDPDGRTNWTERIGVTLILSGSRTLKGVNSA